MYCHLISSLSSANCEEAFSPTFWIGRARSNMDYSKDEIHDLLNIDTRVFCAEQQITYPEYNVETRTFSVFQCNRTCFGICQGAWSSKPRNVPCVVQRESRILFHPSLPHNRMGNTVNFDRNLWFSKGSRDSWDKFIYIHPSPCLPNHSHVFSYGCEDPTLLTFLHL